MPALISQLDVYRSAIPMRSFEHAAARRDLAESVLLRLGFQDGSESWGQTLPRSYVTGETLQTVIQDLRQLLWPMIAGKAPGQVDPDELLEAGAGRCINAAAAAVETACLSRLCREGFGLPACTAGRALADAGGLDQPRRRIAARVSGVLGSRDPRKTARRLRMMRIFGLRDFKLKLGLGEDVDQANLQVVVGQLGRGIASRRCSLRVDVNGAWDAQSTPRRARQLQALGVCAIEQPIFCPAGELAELAARCPLPLLADESLLGRADAEGLLPAGAKVWWNLRISKNGGVRPTLRLARLAADNGIPFTLGCMVGESGLLSNLQRLALSWSPAPRFVEGNFGRFLLAGDLTKRSPRFGYAGRLAPLRSPAGLSPEPARIARYAEAVYSLTC